MKKGIFLPLLTAVVSAALLLGVTLALDSAARENIQAEHEQMLQTLLPGSEHFVLESYAGEDETIRSVHKGETGFVVETVTAGYGGEITMMIGVANEGKVTGLVVRDMSETYGLGAEALTDHHFLAQFLDTAGEAEVGANVDAISGATVTSRAITRSVNAAVAFVTGADIESSATSWGG